MSFFLILKFLPSLHLTPVAVKLLAMYFSTAVWLSFFGYSDDGTLASTLTRTSATMTATTAMSV